MRGSTSWRESTKPWHHNGAGGATPRVDGVREVEQLVGEWATVPDVAERWGVPLSRVRQAIADRELLSWRTGERQVVSVPAKFLGDHGPRPELRGTFTVLADGGMNDEEMLRWLFTPDETLPVQGA